MTRFLPGRHAIESFGNGGFRLGGVSHLGSILIAPSGVRACTALQLDQLSVDDLELLISERTEIYFVLIGSGRELSALPQVLVQHLRDHAIGFEVMTTNAAVRTYNVVLDEGRRVAAVLMAVDKAYG
jgi:uncharacterized protein